MSILTAEPRLQPLGPVAIGVVVFAACHLTHANPYIAAFAAGSVLATLDHVVAERFEPFGELLAELTKFAYLVKLSALAGVAALLWIAVYALTALKRVYGGGWGGTFAKSVGIMTLYCLIALPVLLATVYLAAVLK